MNELIKTVKRYGNSGGVYVPSAWIGGEVKIELLKRPLNPKIDILSKLPLEHIVTVILYGSFVRGEMTKNSDVDVLVVTADNTKVTIPKELKEKYDLQVRSVSQVRTFMERDPIFYKVITDESSALFNHRFIEELKHIQPRVGSMKARVGLAESSKNTVKEMISLGADPIDLVYPLILRLKETLFIECFLANKRYTTALLKKEILNNGISERDFDVLINIYRAARSNRIPKGNVSTATIEKLASVLEAKLSHVKQKALAKRH